MRKFIHLTTMAHLSFIFIIEMGLSSPASAVIFSHIEKSSGIPSNATYNYVIDRWDEEDPNTLNPCYGTATCNVQLNHKHTSGSAGAIAKVYIDDITHLRTMAEVREEFLKTYSMPISGTLTHAGKPIECIGLFYGTASSGLDPDAKLLPGSVCGIAPPPVGSCKVVENSLLIDYKELYISELEEASRNVDVNITCNIDTEITIVASGADEKSVILRNDKSLLANLYIDGQPAYDGVTVNIPKEGQVTVNLESRLKTSGKVDAGAFSGSGFLLLTMP